MEVWYKHLDLEKLVEMDPHFSDKKQSEAMREVIRFYEKCGMKPYFMGWKRNCEYRGVTENTPSARAEFDIHPLSVNPPLSVRFLLLYFYQNDGYSSRVMNVFYYCRS